MRWSGGTRILLLGAFWIAVAVLVTVANRNIDEPCARAFPTAKRLFVYTVERAIDEVLGGGAFDAFRVKLAHRHPFSIAFGPSQSGGRLLDELNPRKHPDWARAVAQTNLRCFTGAVWWHARDLSFIGLVVVATTLSSLCILCAPFACVWALCCCVSRVSIKKMQYDPPTDRLRKKRKSGNTRGRRKSNI